MQTAPVTIASVKRNRGRATLTLSTGETLAMPRAMLKERPYRGGVPFDRPSFDAFLRERSYPFAMEKAVALLAVRARTARELRDALDENAYPPEIIDRVLSRLDEAGYVDDADFAAHWASARASKGLGARRIQMELRRKGVDAEVIERTMDELSEEEQWVAALSAARKAARGKDLSSPQDRQKALAALARRGFDFSLAKRAVQQVRSEEE